MKNRSSLGNHEFDEAVKGLVPFINNVSTPVLAANLILDNVPEMQNLTNLMKSIVIEVQGVKIGIIGYLTPETAILAPNNNVRYDEEIAAIQREMKKLTNHDVNILIALGHSGFVKDLAIAKEVEGLDLVIGGHSNTFLINTETNERPEVREGPYPTIVTQKSGRKVPVVQAYQYTKYLGKLHIVFDAQGEISHFDGYPILLDNSIKQDAEVLQIVNKYEKDINAINEEVVGQSKGLLDSFRCRLKECTIGNVIADAIREYITSRASEIGTCANVAVVQGGRIRASIFHPGTPFNLTRGDWLTVLPFTDSLSIVTMNGSALLEALEHSVDTWQVIDSTGQFLQVSGMRVVYDLSKEPGHRVVSAKAPDSKCGSTEMHNVDLNKEYKLIMPSFLAEGGDGYKVFETKSHQVLPYSDIPCVVEYLSKFSPIEPKLSGRIKILNSPLRDNQNSGVASNHMSNYCVLLGFVTIFRAYFTMSA